MCLIPNSWKVFSKTCESPVTFLQIEARFREEVMAHSAEVVLGPPDKDLHLMECV